MELSHTTKGQGGGSGLNKQDPQTAGLRVEGLATGGPETGHGSRPLCLARNSPATLLIGGPLSKPYKPETKPNPLEHTLVPEHTGPLRAKRA